MSCNGVKKENPRLFSSEIYSYIAHNSKTKLKREQVKECFQIYHDMLLDLMTSEYCDEDMTILLPRIGNFYLKKWHGRKNGSTYKLFDSDKVVTLDKAEPNFYQIKFKVFRPLYETIKNKTKYYE